VRIAFVLAGLDAGGAEKVVNLLAHHRDRCGDEVHVISLNARLPVSFFPYSPSIQLEALGRLPSGPNVGTTATRLMRLRRKLAAIKPDLVISFLTKINVLTCLATIGTGASVITSERNNFTVQSVNAFWRFMAPLAARRSARLVMQTVDAKNALPVNLRTKAAVIPNPVVLPEVDRPAAKSGGTRFVAVGRLERQKGFDLLVDAFEPVARGIEDASLTIHGEGSERPALEAQVERLGLSGRVYLPGTTKAPGDWISPGDIFVLSSRFEGFPNVLLEALTAGMATIAFDCPWGPGEILADRQTGVLVPAENVVALSGAMQKVGSNAGLRRQLAQAGQMAANRYSAPVIAAQWDQVISDAVRLREVGQPVRV
jgi:glycosyltransferase involved in cell wall biosynthesis